MYYVPFGWLLSPIYRVTGKKMMQVTKKSLWHPFPSLMQLIPISSRWSQPDRFLSGGLNTSLRFDGSQMFDMWQNCYIIKWLKLSSAGSLTPASYIVNWKKNNIWLQCSYIYTESLFCLIYGYLPHKQVPPLSFNTDLGGWSAVTK